jgi:hypothetical protein
MQYTDIGHNDPDDMLWILRRDKLDVVKRVTSAGGEPWTHWPLWGISSPTARVRLCRAENELASRGCAALLTGGLPAT